MASSHLDRYQPGGTRLLLGRIRVLLWLSRLRVAYQFSPPATAPGQVVSLQRDHVGAGSVLSRRGQGLWRRHDRPFLLGRIRSCRQPWIRSIRKFLTARRTIDGPIISYTRTDQFTGHNKQTSQWYTVKEQGFRTGIWFSFNGVAQIIGGVIAYGIAVGTEAHPLHIKSWQLLFLVIGLFTASIGVLFLFIMPDNQLNARFLNETERRMAVERIRINQQGVGNKHFKWYQCKEALTDPMIWAFVFYSLVADIPNGKAPLPRTRIHEITSHANRCMA